MYDEYFLGIDLAREDQMDMLKKNIINAFGEEGEQWIVNLPSIVNALGVEWGLTNIYPVDNLTFNYVSKAVTSNNEPVILKISCSENSIISEIQALKYFNGTGSIQLIAHNQKYHALLLQQALPGITLKSLYSSQVEYVMDCYVETMKKLHSQSLNKEHAYPHITEWLKSLDNLSSKHIPIQILDLAIELRDRLLASMGSLIFLHGDLHHDNILKSGDQWLAIDPKGVIGEAEFEIAAFDFMYVDELAKKDDVKNIFETRVNMLADKASLNLQRIKDWVFVRLILMAAWQVEDNGDPSSAIKLASIIM